MRDRQVMFGIAWQEPDSVTIRGLLFDLGRWRGRVRYWTVCACFGALIGALTYSITEVIR